MIPVNERSCTQSASAVTPHYTDDGVTVWHGDALDILRTMPDASVDSVVCDPPYGLAELPAATVVQALTAWLGGDREHVPDGRGFMSCAWDRFVPPPAMWDECLRVLKPGGHLLAFAAPRTADLMTLSIRLAGFEIRDAIAWLHAQGFPKNLNVSKAITATQNHGGANSVRIRQARMGDEYTPSGKQGNRDGVGRCGETGMALGDDPERYRPTELSDDAHRWEGWGTALKPANEPIVVARKPLDGTVAGNVLTHGTGTLNIGGCRTEANGRPARTAVFNGYTSDTYGSGRSVGMATGTTDQGRWPTNVVLTHDEACAERCAPGCPVAELDAQSGIRKAGERPAKNNAVRHVYDGGWKPINGERVVFDSGGASRFYPVFRYEAKADPSQRPKVDGVAHETVKPLDLIRWLVRLVTPPGGVCLDPFAGSGTTAEACLIEGFQCITVERDAKYLPLIVARLSKPLQPTLFGVGGDAA